MRRATPPALLALAAFLTPALAPPLAAQDYRDERLGFELRVPRGWSRIPLMTDEDWVVARFDSEKKDFWTDADSGYTYTHTPSLRVIAFIDALIAKAKEVPEEEGGKADEAEGEEPESEDDPGTTTGTVHVRTIYRDYLDYLRRTTRGSGQGFYVAEDEESTRSGLPVRELDIRFERPTGTGNRRVITWIFDTDIADIAVEFDVLEDEYKKYRNDIQRTLSSYEPVERTQDLGLGDTGLILFLDLEGLPPEARAERRQQAEERSWRRMTMSMPEGWDATEIDGVKVLHHGDPKYAKEVVERIHAVRDWLDETFPEVGRDEYVRMPVVRICKDGDEERAFRRSSHGSGVRGNELVTHKDTYGGAIGGEASYVNDRTLQIWFFDRDYKLWLARPGWLGNGLRMTLGSAKVRGRKLRFDPGSFERYLEQKSRDSREYSIEELMRMTREEFEQHWQDRDYGPFVQVAALTRFLIDGDGSKSKYGDPLPTYLVNLRAVISEVEAEEDAARKAKGEVDEPKTEEEEDALLEAREKALAAKQERILAEAFRRTFGGWSESQWSSFEKAYKKSL